VRRGDRPKTRYERRRRVLKPVFQRDTLTNGAAICSNTAPLNSSNTRFAPPSSPPLTLAPPFSSPVTGNIFFLCRAALEITMTYLLVSHYLLHKNFKNSFTDDQWNTYVQERTDSISH